MKLARTALTHLLNSIRSLLTGVTSAARVQWLKLRPLRLKLASEYRRGMDERRFKPSITRNDALERLRDYYFVSHQGGLGAETAHIAADELLLEIIDDPKISAFYRSIRRYHGTGE
jgi:hypothetical protein